MRNLENSEIRCIGGGVAFVDCMNQNWWENTITGATSGAIAGAFGLGGGAVVGGIVGAVGGSTGTGIYCAVSSIF